MHRSRRTTRDGEPRPGEDQHQLPRTAEPHPAYGNATLHHLANGFSKKIENLAHAVNLHYIHYNFARPHKSIGLKTTPAMAAGLAEYPWTVWDIAQLID